MAEQNGRSGKENQSNSPSGAASFSIPTTPTSIGGTATSVLGNDNSSLIGSEIPESSTIGAFGNFPAATPAFEQPPTSQQSFGGFSNPNTNPGLFGTQQNANTSLFGASNPTPAFGQVTKPGGFGFVGSTGTGLFGQAQQPAQQTAPSIFGATNTAANTSLFENTPGVAGNNTAAGMTGTLVKFSPLTGSDENTHTQTISTRHYCITCMKEYEGKSLEELRLEDYTAWRKGQAQGAQTSGLFGSPAQPSLFGFGAAATGFGATSQPAATSSLFAKPMAGFGATATTSSTFPFNSTTTTSNPFGANTQAKPFGAATATPLFGGSSTTQTPITGFGANNTTSFGSFGNVQTNQSIGLFAQNKPAFNMPASTAPPGFTGFGQNTETNTTGSMLFGPRATPSVGSTVIPCFGTRVDSATTQKTRKVGKAVRPSTKKTIKRGVRSVNTLGESSTSIANNDSIGNGLVTLKDSLAKVRAETGDDFYESESYEAALAIYTEVIGLCPESPAYYDKRAACYMMLGKYREALADAKKCISLDPNCVKAYTTEMKCSLIVGDVGAARTALRKVLELDPNNSRILTDQEHLEYLEKYLRELEMAEARNEFRKVLYCLERCCEVSTSCPAFEQRKAYCLEVLAKQKQEALKRADLARVKAETGDEFYNSKSYEAALAIYTEVIGLCPESPAYHDKRAACYMMLSKYEKALTDAKKCISLDPKCVKAYTTEMKCSLIVGDIGTARTALNKVLELDPNNSSIAADQENLEYVEKFWKESQVALARKEYDKIFMLHVRKVTDSGMGVVAERGDWLYRVTGARVWTVDRAEGEVDYIHTSSSVAQAQPEVIYCLDRCSEVIKLGPAFEQRKAHCLTGLARQKQEKADKAELKTKNAHHLYKTKRYTDALSVYTDIIQLNLEIPVHYCNRAACFMMLSKYGEALADAKRCIFLDPTCIKAHARALKCSLKVGDINSAKSALNKVLELDPNNSNVSADEKDLKHLEKFSTEAEAAYAKSDFLKVASCLDRCCEVSTSCPDFRLRKAESLIFLRKFQEAQEIANDILHHDKENADAIYIRALNSYYQGRDPLPDFQQVLRLAPDHTKALHMYKKAKTVREINMKAIDAYRNGKFDEALEFNTKALSVDPQNKTCNARFHQNKSEAYFALGKIEEALRECTLALKLSEGYPRSLRQRALCHSKLGDFEEAMYDYEHACKFNGSQDNKNLQETKSNFEKSVKKDYYTILGIDKNATIDDIKQAYKKKALVHHPDKHSDAANIEIKKQERKFRQVDEAYATLSDVHQRTLYDQKLNKNNAFGGGSTSRNH